MKKHFLTVCFFCSINIFAQNILFEKSLIPLFNSSVTSITADSSGNYYALSSATNHDFFLPAYLMKLDAGGNILYQKEYAFGENNYLKKIINAGDSCFLICGEANACDYGYCYSIISKLNLS